MRNVIACKRFVFPVPSHLLYNNSLITKAINRFQTDQILTRFVSPPLDKEHLLGMMDFVDSFIVKASID